MSLFLELIVELPGVKCDSIRRWWAAYQQYPPEFIQGQGLWLWRTRRYYGLVGAKKSATASGGDNRVPVRYRQRLPVGP